MSWPWMYPIPGIPTLPNPQQLIYPGNFPAPINLPLGSMISQPSQDTSHTVPGQISSQNQVDRSQEKEKTPHPFSINAILGNDAPRGNERSGPTGTENRLELLAMVSEAIYDVEVLKKAPAPWLNLSRKECNGLVVRKKKKLKE